MNPEKFDLINEDTVYLTAYNEKASFFRGRIIDSSISVEMKLADVLADFFNQDEIKRKFMFSSVFTNSDLSFLSKFNILSEILNTFFPDVLDLFPQVVQDLKTIIHLRSVIDHSMLDTSQEVVDNKYTDRIHLVYFLEGQRKQMVIVDDDFNSAMTTAANVIVGLDHLKVKLNLN